MLRYAFQPESGPFDPERWGGPTPPDRPGERRGLFDGDELLTVCRHYFWGSSVRGRDLTLAGLSAVATPPENRRRGLVRRLCRESLAEYHDRDVPLAALWPFAHGFYARLGWATCNRYATIECPPTSLSFARDAVGGEGRFRQLDPDEGAAMADVLGACDAGHDLAIERPEGWWGTRVFHSWGTDPYVYGWERDGELRGYVVYTVESGEGGGVGMDDSRLLDVTELAATDHEAYLACLGFLADHDSQVGRVRLYGPPDAPLLDLVDDPGDSDVRLHAGPMVRAVSVPAALESVGYPADVEAEFVLGVEDSLSAWNDGAFRVRASGGEATVEPTEADPDAEVGVGPLSQLLVGYRTAASLSETGELSGEPDAIDAVDRLFPPRDPFLRERF